MKPASIASITFLGDLNDLHKVAHETHVQVLADKSVAVGFSAPAHGRRKQTRQVMCVDSILTGQVVGDSSRSMRFHRIQDAVKWLEAGIPVDRGTLDEVDFHALAGEKEAAFRMDQMHLRGEFSPQEFAEIMILHSHSCCDWGMHGESALDARIDYWTDEADEMLIRWPDVTREQRGLANTTYCRMAVSLDYEFREADEAEAGRRLIASLADSD